jgi:uncharacterized protein (TIGR03435 family)
MRQFRALVRLALSCASVVSLLAATLSAQQPTRLEFDVASIKRNVDGSGFMAGGFCVGGDSSIKPTTTAPVSASVSATANGLSRPSISPGTCRFGKTTVREIIAAAYGIPRGEFVRVIVGGPDWLDRDLFDIEARANGNRSQQELERMLQALLADRFSLRLRRDTRELNGYVLTASSDRSANLKASSARTPGSFRTTMNAGNMTINAIATPMSKLTNFLSTHFGQPVTDKTGLAGDFDFTLSWTMGLGEASFLKGLNLPSAPSEPPGDARIGQSAFTVLREHLGLRLEAAKVATDVWIVDQVAAPTAN